MIKRTKAIGFPLMRKEPGEQRVFLPEFIQYISHLGFEVFIEEGYGSQLGLTFDDYQQSNPTIHECTQEEAYDREYVLVLRSPTRKEIGELTPGICLISMLHYPTRPVRLELLRMQNLKAISLDSIMDDHNLRLVENMRAVAWNGIQAAFDVLEKRWPKLLREDGKPWKILVLGTGMVGKHAVEAGSKLGDIIRNNEHIKHNGSGALVLSLGRNISSNKEYMERLFRQTDVLVDATQRRDSSRPVVPNEWIGWLPEHAVIVDLAVDPYTLDADPPVVRGVEGIPQGNLNKYIFQPDDPDWERLVPPSIPSQNRRTTTSCYSWPGIHPEACMRHYGQQLEPLMEVLAEKGYNGLSPKGSYFERALYRATLHGWLKNAGYL